MSLVVALEPGYCPSFRADGAGKATFNPEKGLLKIPVGRISRRQPPEALVTVFNLYRNAALAEAALDPGEEDA